MTHPGKCCPPADPIIQRPTQVFRDFYHPQLVQVIHPIEVINRHHCVPVFKHVHTYIERNVGPISSHVPCGPYGAGAAIANAKRRKR
ncbi:hypothetical protein EXW96_12535 [Paenibacillus sp. JMULE4]|nr:hypothetical protein [Paenibacillus sp. JMULE4]